MRIKIYLKNEEEIFFQKLNDDDLKKSMSGNLEHLVLSITNECNFRCGYCICSGNYKHQKRHKNLFRDSKVALNAIEFFGENLYNKNDLTISFYGGEPLINFKLIKEAIEKIRLLKQGKKEYP